jgi:hypothetical protein
MDAEEERRIRRSHRIEQQLGNILLRVRGIIAKPGVPIEEKERSIGIALEAVRRINPPLAEEARLAIVPLLEVLRQRQQGAPAKKSTKKVNKKPKVTVKAATTGSLMSKASAPAPAPASASGFAAASPGFFFQPPPPRHPRQSNILSSELDDLTRLLKGTTLGSSESVMAGAPSPVAAVVQPPSPPYSPSPDAILAELDGLMLRLGHRLHITEGPNYAPQSPKGGKRNTLSRRRIKRKTRTQRK